MSNRTVSPPRSVCPSIENAVCVCGHYYDDHRCADINYTTGRITLAECLDTTCPCAVYTVARQSRGQVKP